MAPLPCEAEAVSRDATLELWSFREYASPAVQAIVLGVEFFLGYLA